MKSEFKGENNMKTYKDFEKKYIGGSDIASLVMVGCRRDEGLKTEPLFFGEDGAYYAYIVDEETEIKSHYTKVAAFNHWLKIYDDDGLTFVENAKEINVYRAGQFGCIIQIIQ